VGIVLVRILRGDDRVSATMNIIFLNSFYNFLEIIYLAARQLLSLCSFHHRKPIGVRVEG